MFGLNNTQMKKLFRGMELNAKAEQEAYDEASGNDYPSTTTGAGLSKRKWAGKGKPGTRTINANSMGELLALGSGQKEYTIKNHTKDKAFTKRWRRESKERKALIKKLKGK